MKHFYNVIVLFFIVLGLNTNTEAALKVGDKAPAFTLPSIDGKDISLSDYLGKIVIIHMWKCQ